jgi:hypothetical protein
MIKDKDNRLWKVVAVTPAGRKVNMEILKKYIYRDMSKGLIDNWQIWQNTDNQVDIDYFHELEKENIKNKICYVPGIVGRWGYTIVNFFKFANDLDTVYIRYDDDICWIADDVTEKLAKARLDNPNPFVISANVVNNSLMAFIHQSIGALGRECGNCNYSLNDILPWRDSNFADLVHDTFIRRNNSNALNAYFFEDKTLLDYERFSINCFTFFAKDLSDMTDIEEEQYISHKAPKKFQRPNLIKGDALVVHYSYFDQRAHMDATPKYLEYYSNLAKQL